ncbi:hypothetical protein E3V39_03770 [Gammaproteobacteria bacterium LSUCC0112]|nr:hypothetical protein E3V39_03770 [Gammaproteobacteria bacterium LSUCC0112]
MTSNSGDNSFDWNIYSHLEGYLNDIHSTQGKDDYFILGESTFFLSGNFGDELSILYEGTYQPKRYRDDVLKSERWQIRYALPKNHYLIVGKNHTPVTHWNDSFHHGRLFYPSISRPLSLDKFVPLHDSAVRVGARSLGEHGFFYDLSLGSGHRYENKFFSNGVLSETVSVGLQSEIGNVVRLGWHRNAAHRVGHGITTTPLEFHSNHHLMGGMVAHDHPEVLDVLTVIAMSVRLELGRVELLTEAAVSDGSRDTENNRALYQYLGYRLTDNIVPYAVIDWLKLERGLGLRAGVESRSGVGVKIMLTDSADLKLESLRHRDGTKNNTPAAVEFRMQLSVSLK